MIVLLGVILAAFGVAFVFSGLHLIIWGLWTLIFGEN